MQIDHFTMYRKLSRIRYNIRAQTYIRTPTSGANLKVKLKFILCVLLILPDTVTLDDGIELLQ